jgi:hypothetical protein
MCCIAVAIRSRQCARPLGGKGQDDERGSRPFGPVPNIPLGSACGDRRLRKRRSGAAKEKRDPPRGRITPDAQPQAIGNDAFYGLLGVVVEDWVVVVVVDVAGAEAAALIAAAEESTGASLATAAVVVVVVSDDDVVVVSVFGLQAPSPNARAATIAMANTGR